MKIAGQIVVVKVIFLLAILAGGLFLQLFLSRRQSRWPGLVLPLLTFLISLLYLFSLADSGSVLQNILMALVTLLLGNLPTLILLAIYWAAREKLRKQSELEKMNIRDL